MSGKVRLTVRFVDRATGRVRELSGTYPAISAMSRIEWAEKQQEYVGHNVEAA